MDTRSRSLLPLLPLPLLLLVLLMLLSSVSSVSEGISQPFKYTSKSPAHNLKCPADITVSGAQESARIVNIQDQEDEKLKYWQTSIYVHPEEGFKGVSLVAQVGRRNTYTALFPLDKDTCFPHSDEVEWWLVLAVVQYVKKAYEEYIEVQLRTEGCNAMCRIRGSFRGAVSLYVEAHGPSSWRYEKPDPNICNVGYTVGGPSQNLSCSITSPQQPTPPQFHPSSIPSNPAPTTVPDTSNDTEHAGNPSPKEPESSPTVPTATIDVLGIAAVVVIVLLLVSTVFAVVTAVMIVRVAKRIQHFT